MSFEFVDAHHHFWDLSRPGYTWLKAYVDPAGEPLRKVMESLIGPYSDICKSFSPADLLTVGRPAGLLKSVHIETAGGDEWASEAQWIQELSEKTGMPGAQITACDLSAPDVEKRLDGLMRHSSFRGVRSITFIDARHVYEDAFWRGLSAMAERRLVLDADFDWTLFPVLEEIATRFPDLKVTLGHAGFPKLRSPRYLEFWRKALLRLASTTKMHCKISGFGMIDHSWTVESIRPWIEAAIDAFGSDRIMFGSNWPVDSLYSSYGKLWQAYDQLTAGFSQQERQKMFVRNAEKFYVI